MRRDIGAVFVQSFFLAVTVGFAQGIQPLRADCLIKYSFLRFTVLFDFLTDGISE